jgi:DNA-binding IclR family transcriptional regulator
MPANLLDDHVARAVLAAVLREPSEFTVRRLTRPPAEGLGLTKKQAQKAVHALARAGYLAPRGFRRFSRKPPASAWAGVLAVQVWRVLNVEKEPLSLAQLAEKVDRDPKSGDLRRALGNLELAGAISTPAELWPSPKALALELEVACPSKPA